MTSTAFCLRDVTVVDGQDDEPVEHSSVLVQGLCATVCFPQACLTASWCGTLPRYPISSSASCSIQVPDG